jgi:hypothetical protein
MINKPPEITDEEWESMTSPENYYRDGEVTPQEADRIFRRQVEDMVRRRRQG